MLKRTSPVRKFGRLNGQDSASKVDAPIPRPRINCPTVKARWARLRHLLPSTDRHLPDIPPRAPPDARREERHDRSGRYRHVACSASAAGVLREALPLLGSTECVIGLPNSLSVGPIDPPDPKARQAWSKSRLRNVIDAASVEIGEGMGGRDGVR